MFRYLGFFVWEGGLKYIDISLQGRYKHVGTRIKMIKLSLSSNNYVQNCYVQTLKLYRRPIASSN